LGTHLARKPNVKAVLLERAISKSNAARQPMKVIAARQPMKVIKAKSEPAIHPHPTPEEVLCERMTMAFPPLRRRL
jgi:hypothetical protein